MTERHSSSESGSAAVEFAISAIVLFTLLFGCVGVSMAFYTYEVVTQYARDASRYAIVHGNNCTIASGTNAGNSCSIGTGGGNSAPASVALKTYLNNQIYPGINGNNLNLTITYAMGPGEASCNVTTNCNGPGDQVTVNVSYQYLYNIPFIPTNLITMNGTSTMVISQ